jgi:hypothetical protein
MPRSHQLTLEPLEDRTAPATFGISWPDPSRLSLSFVPDGTLVAGQQSQLFRLLNAVAPTQTWEQVILRAFQTWAAPTNINFSVVPDTGDPLGMPGLIQHDPRFGDIRIAAVPMSSDVLALGLPFDFSAGRWAGTVEFNSNCLFGINGSTGSDLFTVALHEAGHALSMASSADPSSVMYDSLTGIYTALSSNDIANIQALYGVRPSDSSNSSLANATAVNLSTNGNGLNPVAVDAALVSPADVDYYSFKVGNNQTGLTIMVQTAGISLVTPILTISSPTQGVMATASAPDPLHGDLTVHLANLMVGAVYYTEIAGATGDVFSVGTYRMQIVPDGAAPASGTPSAVPALPADGHSNDSIGTATDIRNSMYHMSTAYAYAVQTGLVDSTDVDYFHLRTPQGPSGSSVVMSAMVWGTALGGLSPVLSVYDAQGHLINATVLVSENNSYVVQVPSALPNSDYYVMVGAEEPNGLNNTGNYFLGIEFTGEAVALQNLTSGTLTQAAPLAVGTLEITQSEVAHLVLSATNSQASAGTGLVMTIYDQFGNAVSSLTVMNGETKSLTAFMGPGNYTVQISGIAADGSLFAPLSYTLFGLDVSDPIGVSPTNPTTTPTNGSKSCFIAGG